MNWGNWIVVSFVVFTIFIATLVTICVRQDVGLVSQDYYKDELVYQDQIERISNANSLVFKPVISVVDKTLIQIRFEQFNSMENGELLLFSPSDEKRDRKFVLKPTTANVLQFHIDAVPQGMYKARMKWQMDDKEFYIEEIINF
jgi:hypothetical protein